MFWRNAGPQGFWLMATHCSTINQSKVYLFFEVYRFKTNLNLVYNSFYVLLVYNFIILLDTCNCNKRVKEIVFYLAQFNITYHLVLGCCTPVMQSFKNKYYVTD